MKISDWQTGKPPCNGIGENNNIKWRGVIE